MLFPLGLSAGGVDRDDQPIGPCLELRQPEGLANGCHRAGGSISGLEVNQVICRSRGRFERAHLNDCVISVVSVQPVHLKVDLCSAGIRPRAEHVDGEAAAIRRRPVEAVGRPGNQIA